MDAVPEGEVRAVGAVDVEGLRVGRGEPGLHRALPEAAAFWTEALRCAPDDGAARLEPAEVHAWSGRTDQFEREWDAALDRLPAADRAAAWCRRGLLFRTVVCNPAASFETYRRAQDWQLRSSAGRPAGAVGRPAGAAGYTQSPTSRDGCSARRGSEGGLTSVATGRSTATGRRR